MWQDEQNMDDITSLTGPVESEGGQLVLRIPLEEGGDELIQCAREISQVDGDCLKIMIPKWLANKLHIADGSLVTVDNKDGKLNIHPIPPVTQ